MLVCARVRACVIGCVCVCVYVLLAGRVYLYCREGINNINLYYIRGFIFYILF